MSDFVRTTLDHLAAVLFPTLGKVLGTVLAYLFVGPAELYHLTFIAIALDTLTGLYKAHRLGKLKSHTMRIKLMSKLASYAAAVSGAGLLHHALQTMGLDHATTMFAVKFTLVSIVVTEVLSMWENIAEATGEQVVAKKAFRKFLDQFIDDEERR